MRLARGALSGVFFLSYGVVGILFTFLVLPFVRSPRAVRRTVRFLFRVFVATGRVTGLFTVAVEGDLSSAAGRVVAMNHLTLIDVIVLMAHLGDATCVVKGAIRRNPVMSRIVRRIFLANDDDPAVTLAAATRLLREGVSVIVFPEGTRTPADAPEHRLHRGAARLALAARADILPVRLAVDPPVLARGQPWWDVGARTVRYRLAVGSAIPADGPNDRAGAIALTERLKTAIICGNGCERIETRE